MPVVNIDAAWLGELVGQSHTPEQLGDALDQIGARPDHACRLDVLEVDRDERVAVFARLLVPEADGVADLVDGVAGRAARARRPGRA